MNVVDLRAPILSVPSSPTSTPSSSFCATSDISYQSQLQRVRLAEPDIISDATDCAATVCQSPVYLTSPSRGHCSNTIQIKLPVMCTTDHVNVILQYHRILNSVSLVRLSTFQWLDTTRQHHDRAGGKTESSFRLKYHSQAIVKGHSTKQLTCSGENFQR